MRKQTAMTNQSFLKIGVYVDAANLMINGGYGMRYKVLRAFSCRGGAEPIRLNIYISFDGERAKIDSDYKKAQFRFQAELRDIGFKIIQKEVKWYTDDRGVRIGKGNVDLEMAVDALLQSENIDRVLLATGDGDFIQVVKALQNKGCRVEVIAFDNVSAELRREADFYLSGYLIPNLLPIKRLDNIKAWGEVGSYVRGTCYSFDHDKNYGFIKYLTSFDDKLWITDDRDPKSPYASIFFHESDLPDSIDPRNLPRRNLIFEFQIQKNDEGKTRAVAINCIDALT